MHYLQLIDSIVILFPSPVTVHMHHPYYHKLKESKSLEEAEQILSVPYSELWYLFEDSTILELNDMRSSNSNLIAVFTTKEDCYKYYPELFI